MVINSWLWYALSQKNLQSQTQNKARWLARVRIQPIIALYFESENELKFYNLEAFIVFNGFVFIPDLSISILLFIYTRQKKKRTT